MLESWEASRWYKPSEQRVHCRGIDRNNSYIFGKGPWVIIPDHIREQIPKVKEEAESKAFWIKLAEELVVRLEKEKKDRPWKSEVRTVMTAMEGVDRSDLHDRLKNFLGFARVADSFSMRKQDPDDCFANEP